MHRLFLLGVLMTLAACGMNEPTNGANANPKSFDAATKARMDLAGVPGGTGARVPKEANGGATVGNGTQHRYSLGSL